MPRKSGLCPGLRKSKRTGKFYCSYNNNMAVDPWFYPCIMEYESCPIYKRWREEHRRKKSPRKKK